MTNRRSSIYTIRLTGSGPYATALKMLSRGLTEQHVPTVDFGNAAVSFRSTDDATALRTAKAAAAHVQRDMILTTGLGVHRRTVT